MKDEQPKLWSSGKVYNNQIIDDQTPYKFLRSNEYNPTDNL